MISDGIAENIKQTGKIFLNMVYTFFGLTSKNSTVLPVNKKAFTEVNAFNRFHIRTRIAGKKSERWFMPARMGIVHLRICAYYYITPGLGQILAVGEL